MTRAERAQRFWDRSAASYDAASGWLERRWLGDGRRWATTRAQGDILDVAVGTGTNLALYPSDSAVTGLDWSAGMIDQARKKAAELPRTVDLRQADATAIPFPDSSFDSVVCTFGLCCIPDDRAAMAEMLRVLRPGGRLLLADHVVASNPLLRAGQHLLESVTVPLQSEHYTRRPRPILEALGARIVEAERRSGGAFEWVHATT